MDSLVAVVVPALVAVLTAAGAVIGLEFRDVDAYERRRGIWQWLLVLLAAVATMGATGSASGVGSLWQAVLMAVVAVAAIVFAHVMWRRRVPDAEPRIQAIATAAALSAVVVVVGSTALIYVQNTGCRQVDPLVQSSRASSAFVMPAVGPNQGPTVGDYQDWAKIIREQADQVTKGEAAQHAQRLAEVAEQIADSVRTNNTGRHYELSVEFYDELKPILTKCQIQLTA
ncbi:hypothetical protein A5740_14175 [Mycobacterium sp. GA-1841]|uniref:hypothetical protein n=1 Tax=Mycobacterium sp. GA-1841 TaxID=1834154 RepID=UPI00096FA3F7|nr:hypothetical protein [Mycobacterium sp. GA-1841]OMC31829.1 hypothetical protein A5740_14175 [Mycobacterium sp. GA-1841]